MCHNFFSRLTRGWSDHSKCIIRPHSIRYLKRIRFDRAIFLKFRFYFFFMNLMTGWQKQWDDKNTQCSGAAEGGHRPRASYSSCIGDHPYKLTIQLVLYELVPGTRGVRFLEQSTINFSHAENLTQHLRTNASFCWRFRTDGYPRWKYTCPPQGEHHSSL